MRKEKLLKTLNRFLELPDNTPRIAKSILSSALSRTTRQVIIENGRYWYVVGDRKLPGPDLDDKGLDDTLIVILGEDDVYGQGEEAET